MAFRTPRARAGLSRRPRWLVPTLVGVVIALVALGVFTTVWTNVLWYQAVGYLGVYGTRLRARVVLFLISGLVMAAIVAGNIVAAYRLRPPYRALTPEQQGLERYRTMLEPRLRVVLAGIVALIGLITGLAMEGQWRTWLLFMNQQPFGATDPQFGKDVSYFAFTYPFLRMLIGFGFAVILVALIAAAVTHYLYGGIRLQSPDEKVGSAARGHLSVLLGLFVLLKAWAYWLDRYGLVLSGREAVPAGASYTDVNAVLPAKTILAIIAVLCAGLFFAAVVRRGLLLPAAAFGLLILSAILIGGLYPAAIQRFQVEPTEQAKERPYIKRNIEATRSAYSVDNVNITGYNATTDPSNVSASARGGDIPGIRLLDPGVVPPTFQQLQQIRGFYEFAETLDIGRYTMDGEKAATVVAVRGIKGPPQGQRNWVNDHLVYTHGFGFVAARASNVTQGGAPQFVAQNIPPQGQLGKYQPRVYFGQNVPGYSIVGAPKNAPPQELDFPDNSSDGQAGNTYEGSGGVAIGSTLKQMVYALQFQDANIFLSDTVNRESRMMYIREPRERVQRVAPFLELDGNPYPAIVNGRIVWIVDAYTTTNMYPYSTRTTLEEATRDTNTVTSGAIARQPEKPVNYISNSVKAVVDAYNGSVRLYQWDEKDPVLKAWMNAFPELIKPRSAIPDALRQHLRYPEDLFKVQREILERYHVTQPDAFYGGQDFWEVPDDPTTGQGVPQPPYYMMLQMPDSNRPVYSLTSTYVPRDRPNLAAFMAVDSSANGSYGQLQVLRLPRSTSIAGPGQMQNDFLSDANVRKSLALLGQGDAQINYGNLLTLPVGGGLLYVEPVYVRASAGQSYPLLQRVLVSFGSNIGYAATLEKALAEIFPGGTTGGGQDAGGDGTTEQPSTGQPESPELQEALQEAQSAYEDAQQALRNGNWTEYGKAQQRLEEALSRAQEIQNSEGSEDSGSSNGSGGSGESGGSGGSGGG